MTNPRFVRRQIAAIEERIEEINYEMTEAEGDDYEKLSDELFDLETELDIARNDLQAMEQY